MCARVDWQIPVALGIISEGDDRLRKSLRWQTSGESAMLMRESDEDSDVNDVKTRSKKIWSLTPSSVRHITFLITATQNAKQTVPPETV
jgi:hypothetical protein